MDETCNRSYESKFQESHLLIADPLCAIYEGLEQENPLKYQKISLALGHKIRDFKN
jgi:hypothetical protein